MDSDLRAGVDLDEVIVETYAEPESPHVGQRKFTLSTENPLPEGKFGIPFSFYTSRNTADRFLLAVSGWKAGEKVVEQHQWVTFEAGKTRFLQVFLGGICHRRICADAERTCFPFKADDVPAGTCGAVPEATLIADDPRGADGTWGVDAAPFDWDAGASPGADDETDAADGADDTEGSMDGDEQCESGYELDGEGGCQDIDECEADDACGRGECHNTNGSYRCGDCEPGYGPDEDDVCVDLDECERDTHTCDRDPETPCMNTEGGFECGACPAGFAGDAKRGEQGCVPVLDDLVVSRGKLEPAFDPLVTEYQVDVGPWPELVEITPTHERFHDLTVQGATVGAGPFLQRELEVGDNIVQLELASGGSSRRYQVTLARKDATESQLNAQPVVEGASFGCAVAVSDEGSTFAIGAFGEEPAGAAYVVTRTAGEGTSQHRLVASDLQRGDGFGSLIALSGDGNTLAVGTLKAGNAYVFERSGNSWGNGVNLRYKAQSLALSRDGKLLAVGLPGNSPEQRGLVYLFTRKSDGWSEPVFFGSRGSQALAQSDSGFGMSVAVSGDGNWLAVLSAPETQDQAGTVYTTTRSSGTWQTPSPIELADDVGTSGTFGLSMSLSDTGTTLAIADLMSQAVHIFVRDGQQWKPDASLGPTNPGLFGAFGIAMAMSGDGRVLAVGEYYLNGAAYLFTRSRAGWGEPQKFLGGSGFGRAIGLSGDGRTLAVGAEYQPTCVIQGSGDCEAAGSVIVYD